MNIMAAVLAFCAMPLVLGLFVRVLKSRKGRSWSSFLCAMAFLAVLLLAVALWMSRSGTAVNGVLAGKNENLSIDDTGLSPSVLRRFTLTVADAEAQARFARWPMRGDLEIDVDETLFDSLRRGQFLGMHEWILGPLKFAHLNVLPWWDVAPGLLHTVADAVGWRSGPDGRTVEGQAEVENVRTVRDAYPFSLFSGGSTGGVHVILKQPYDEVRLRIHTATGVEALAVDRIDAGSGGVFAPGTRVPVTYPVHRPRAAELVLGTRRYALRNSLAYWSSECISLGVLIAVIGVAVMVRRRRAVIRA